MTHATDPNHSARPRAAFFGMLGLVAVALAGLEIATLGHNHPFGLDRPWHDLLAAHRSVIADAVGRALNVVGGTTVMMIVTVLAVLALAFRRQWTAAVSVAMAVAVSSGVSTLLKDVVGRPRPLDGIVGAATDSFPSGHATTAAAITIALVIAFPRAWAIALASVWIPVMAFSRTYLLVHWLSDVIAGAVLGAAVALVVSSAVRAIAASGWFRGRILKEPSPERPVLRGRHPAGPGSLAR